MKKQKGMILADNILSMFQTIYLARHCNAVLHIGVTDHQRTLSEKGLRQALKLKEIISARNKERGFDLVLASPLVRARQTASIVTGFDPNNVVILNTLNLSEKPTDPLNVMFKDLGYRRLVETENEIGYFQHRLGNTLKKRALEAVAEIVQVVNKRFQKIERTSSNLSIFVGGHAVFQPAIMWAIGHIFEISRRTTYSKAIKMLAEKTKLGEGEILVLHSGGSSIMTELIKP